MSLLGVSTPALLFPAISLLLLAYTNRFLVIAQLIRSLYKQYNETPDKLMAKQIDHLRKRIRLIKQMQTWGVVAFIFCTLAMICLFFNGDMAGQMLFLGSLLLLLCSLVFCLIEISISGYALNIQLENLSNEAANQDRKDHSNEANDKR